MKIYTKKGDSGETSLWGGTRIPKDDLRIQTYGTFDELNAVIGISLTSSEVVSPQRDALKRIQGELFQLGAELATPRGRSSHSHLLEGSQVEALEKEIDEMERELPALKTFILPGGAESSAWLHLARTVSRRAERELVSLNRADPVRPIVLQYMNRLSDFFFVFARYMNFKSKVQDVPWMAPHV